MPLHVFAFVNVLKRKKRKRNKKEGMRHWFVLMHYILLTLADQDFDFWIDLNWVKDIDLFL